MVTRLRYRPSRRAGRAAPTRPAPADRCPLPRLGVMGEYLVVGPDGRADGEPLATALRVARDQRDEDLGSGERP